MPAEDGVGHRIPRGPRLHPHAWQSQHGLPGEASEQNKPVRGRPCQLSSPLARELSCHCHVI